MPLPVISNVYRCAFNWDGTMSDRPVVSVQHFRTTKAIDELASDLDALATTTMFSYTEATVEASSVDITPLDGVSASQSFSLANWHSSGGATETLPGFNVMVLGSTGLRGPSNRGRIFLPSPGENVITDGLLDSGNADAITDAWNDFRVNAGIESIEYGVASYVTPDFTTYTSLLCSRKLGVIRRRRNAA